MGYRSTGTCITNIHDDYIKGTDHAGTFMSLKGAVYYAKYRSWHQSSKIQVFPS